jgi:hypothetical protein
VVYNTQNHWVYGPCPSSGILNNRNTAFRKLHQSPSSGGFSDLRLALSKGPDGIDVSLPSPEDGNRPRFRNVVFFNYI